MKLSSVPGKLFKALMAHSYYLIGIIHRYIGNSRGNQWEYEAAITERTAGIVYVFNRSSCPPLAEVVPPEAVELPPAPPLCCEVLDPPEPPVPGHCAPVLLELQANRRRALARTTPRKLVLCMLDLPSVSRTSELPRIIEAQCSSLHAGRNRKSDPLSAHNWTAGTTPRTNRRPT